MSSYSDFVKDIVKSGVRKIRYLKGRTESAFLFDEKAWGGVSLIDGGDCSTKIKPAVGPAGYDAGYLFLCKK